MFYIWNTPSEDNDKSIHGVRLGKKLKCCIGHYLKPSVDFVCILHAVVIIPSNNYYTFTGKKNDNINMILA